MLPEGTEAMLLKAAMVLLGSGSFSKNVDKYSGASGTEPKYSPDVIFLLRAGATPPLAMPNSPPPMSRSENPGVASKDDIKAVS